MSVSGPLTEKLKDNDSVLLRLLADPEAMRVRLEELNKAEERAKAVIDLVGPADQILKLRESAEVYLEAQKRVLFTAEARANSIVAAAESRRVELLAALDADTKAAANNLVEAREELRKARLEAEAILADAANKAAASDREIQQKQTQLDAELARTANAQFQLDQERAEVAEQRASIDAKLAKLIEVWNEQG